jgi:tetratricopeptide (TPR) repeat protein
LVRAICGHSLYLDPYNRKTHLLLARLYRARGALEESLNEFHVFLWSNDDAVVRVELALLLRQMGRVEEARREAEKALKSDPANEQARRLLDGAE